MLYPIELWVLPEPQKLKTQGSVRKCFFWRSFRSEALSFGCSDRGDEVVGVSMTLRCS